MHKFTIPSLPPSMNGIYNVLYHLRRIEMKPEVRLWKNNAKVYIPPWLEEKTESGIIWISLQFFGNWFTKAGKVKKIDSPNLVKVVLDTIAEKLGFDDSMIFDQRGVKKVQSDTEQKIEVELGYIEDVK